MTDKELHRLSRRELLQLLLTQAKDTEELRRLTEEQGEQLESLKNSYDHLKRRLDQKDAQIHELRMTLHEERSNRKIELEEAGSIAEAALRLNGIFETAQKAAEQYLYNIKLRHEKEEPHREELFEDLDLEMSENSEKNVFPEESENWGEGIAKPEFSEDMTEVEPEVPEEERKETESEAPEEIRAESETENPQENMVEPVEENSAEDASTAESEEPKRRIRGGKKRERHKK